jgi:hypothetical protein
MTDQPLINHMAQDREGVRYEYENGQVLLCVWEKGERIRAWPQDDMTPVYFDAHKDGTITYWGAAFTEERPVELERAKVLLAEREEARKVSSWRDTPLRDWWIDQLRGAIEGAEYYLHESTFKAAKEPA